ncbi:hypothetical protein [Streptomyces rubradiris]|uniref:Major tail protein n=1 Tax=Streptomyces rubradiris TaxID=285531 RepID=A0ABQ3R3K1_STRRR|nr:hypothetical protein [Streptomyces rubradiris]GHH30261.1 hypothetical protein GCM10018792_76530 [Streptomyces rubradiris]GHI50434.1 hypothetical protein Srubr_02800 [Streptomyces rubradiris]
MKTSGLGDNLYIAGFDASGDIQALGTIGGGPALLNRTPINKAAYQREGGLLSGQFEMTTFFNSDPVNGGTHEKLSALPRNDVIMTYCRGTNLGDPSASLVAKQVNYDPTRGDDGMLTFAVSAQSNGYSIEWGRQLTAGVRTDTAATNGTSIDTTAAASFGAQAYLQVFSFVGTDATVKIQDSADNSVFADVAGLAFTPITAGPTTERIAVSNTTTIRRYVRAVTVTTGGFTSLAFSVNFIKNENAGVTF